mmetsp:Transcript_39978/g.106077  ORF Transcript_39978/g.106077 Transcript_39978/m.106077 type:complete len:211 (+) Transcript_39978:206-838(+)
MEMRKIWASVFPTLTVCRRSVQLTCLRTTIADMASAEVLRPRRTVIFLSTQRTSIWWSASEWIPISLWPSVVQSGLDPLWTSSRATLRSEAWSCRAPSKVVRELCLAKQSRGSATVWTYSRTMRRSRSVSKKFSLCTAQPTPLCRTAMASRSTTRAKMRWSLCGSVVAVTTTCLIFSASRRSRNSSMICVCPLANNHLVNELVNRCAPEM